MGLDSSAGGCGGRRGLGRAAALVVLLATAALLTGGCGGAGHGAETDPEKGSDAEALNGALAQELALLDVYAGGGNRPRALWRTLRAHEHEYVDALTKAVRGLGGDTEAAPEASPSPEPRRRALLTQAYRLESAVLALYLDAAPRLYTPAPRALAASLAAAHAQHLVALRRQLGAGSAASIATAFDGGRVPAPAGGPGGRG